jgi:hypothetical protein
MQIRWLEAVMVVTALAAPACGGAVTGTADGGTPGTTGSSSGNYVVTSPAVTGTGTGSSSGTPTTVFDAGVPDEPDTSTGPDAGMCGAVVVQRGSFFVGSTCTGVNLPDESPCQEPLHPVVYFYVDAPDGLPLTINSTAPLAILAFGPHDGNTPDACAAESVGGTSGPLECTFSATTFTLTSNTNLRLFAIERNDVICGDFNIVVQ